MVKLTDEQKNKIQAMADEFKEKYLETEQGKNHLEHYKRERKEVQKVFTFSARITRGAKLFCHGKQ